MIDGAWSIGNAVGCRTWSNRLCRVLGRGESVACVTVAAYARKKRSLVDRSLASISVAPSRRLIVHRRWIGADTSTEETSRLDAGSSLEVSTG